MARLTLFFGERNSGKSVVAEDFALSRSVRPVYGITLPACAEFATRIRQHQERRGAAWEELDLIVPSEQARDRLDHRASQGGFILIDGLASLFWAQYSLFGRSRGELASFGASLVTLIVQSGPGTEWALVDCPVPLPQTPELQWFNALMADFYRHLREAVPHVVLLHQGAHVHVPHTLG